MRQNLAQGNTPQVFLVTSLLIASSVGLSLSTSTETSGSISTAAALALTGCPAPIAPEVSAKLTQKDTSGRGHRVHLSTAQLELSVILVLGH